MKFVPLRLSGAYLIEPDLIKDERGFFARTFCREEFLSNSLITSLEQCSISYNHKKGTLRGMHYQQIPHGEVKVVRCTQGAIYDVIVDLRSDSSTFKYWESVELTAENRKMLYIPEGVAHGFQTLQDNTEVFYQISNKYVPLAARGVRWNDPQLRIEWPMAPSVISDRDKLYEDFIV
ncbi:MAG: dTDP-4-dehydrorhamnose 3,5-epimerase [Verrucomicrobia bacterium]|nr:dTDP-4-dehydrorhamnose 3,5-epimerase [Verrucomicrobiota bacterium]